jgi:hypothetical protein
MLVSVQCRIEMLLYGLNIQYRTVTFGHIIMIQYEIVILIKRASSLSKKCKYWYMCCENKKCKYWYMCCENKKCKYWYMCCENMKCKYSTCVVKI